MRRVLISLILVGMFGTGLVWAKETGKIGVIYLRKVFDSYEKTKDYDKKLQEETKQIEKKIRDLQQEIQKIQASLEVLGKEEKKEKIKELRKKQLELRRYRLEAMQDIGQERQRYMREILQDIKPIINDYAKKNGYDIILNGDMILYSVDSYDLTQEIVDLLNRSYRSEKK